MSTFPKKEVHEYHPGILHDGMSRSHSTSNSVNSVR